MRRLRNALLLLLLAVLLAGAALWHLSWHPPRQQPITPLCRGNAASLVPGQALKIMTWNVQSLAGKRELAGYPVSAADAAPTGADRAHSLDEVARVIREENPDVVLLQEVDNGSQASNDQDQLALLRERLADLYPCSAQAFDWKTTYLPRRVGRTLATFSRYRIERAERLQLPQPGNALTQLFSPRPALLSSYLNVADGSVVAVLNTQMAPYQPGDDSQREQLITLLRRLDRLEGQGTPWLLGGDFNALPLGQYRRLEPEQAHEYDPESSLHLLWDRYPMVPSNAQAGGRARDQWLTFFASDSPNTGPDRTLDYLFHSPALGKVEASVRQADTLAISDHLPLLARFLLPAPVPQ